MVALPRLVALGVLSGVLALSLSPPALADSAAVVASDKARSELDRLGSWVMSHGGKLTASVVEVETGRALFGRTESLELNPASNAKILTAATALEKLGPDHRFTSGVYGEIRDGVADRLVLRSNGDPSLSARDLELMASSLAGAGLKRVSGDILVDQSYFDDKFVPPAFAQQPKEWAGFRAPVSAVSVDENTFVVRVRAAREGARADIKVFPAGFVEIVNGLDTVQKGEKKKISIQMDPRPDKLRVKLSGRIPEGHPGVSFVRRVDDPRLYAGSVLSNLLSHRGISVDGGVKLGGKGEQHVLVEQRSKPLSVLLEQMGKNSDNFYAEMILKTVGAESTKSAGTSADGASAVVDWMKSAGAVSSGTRVENGSGLFDANRVSAQSLATALAFAYRDSRTAAAFVDQLSIGGVDGTLKGRFRSQKKRRAIRAKTGTLARAHALSGFVLAPKGRSPVAFSILINGIAGKASEQRRRIDRVVEELAREVWK